MKRVLMGAAALGVLAVLAAPAWAQEDQGCCAYGYVTEGKHASRKMICEEPFRMPETMMVSVPLAERREGDAVAYRTVGKRAERVILREVALPAETAKAGHECFFGYVAARKAAERRMFCEVNGKQILCPGMSEETGVCLAK